jgi:glycosylphosphatidylinositol transamidase
LTLVTKPTIQHFQLTKSFSLLVLGMCLSTLATLNFSLAFLVGVLSSPLSFVQPVKNPALRWSLAGLLNIVAPPTVVYVAAQLWDISIADLLKEASFGWNVWGMYTPVVIWCLWWPAWLVGMVNVFGEVTT